MHVAVLTGGKSLERQVSLRSAGRVADALERLGHGTSVIDIGPDLVDRLQVECPEVAFVAVHGEQGEDGTLQEVLEMLSIPFTGSRAGATRRCWDKAAAKEMLREIGVSTPDFLSFSQAGFAGLGAGRALSAVEERIGFPLVVKPARQGSALGIRMVQSASDLPAALLAAFSYDDRVVLERYVRGRDLAVSVIEAQDGPRALPVVEATPQDEHFYDFEARYSIGSTSYTCPAALEPACAAEAQDIALRVYERFGCAGLARIDMMLGEDGRLEVLEANSVPGFTETSLLPMAAEAAGITFDDLVARLVDQALQAEPSTAARP